MLQNKQKKHLSPTTAARTDTFYTTQEGEEYSRMAWRRFEATESTESLLGMLMDVNVLIKCQFVYGEYDMITYDCNKMPTSKRKTSEMRRNKTAWLCFCRIFNSTCYSLCLFVVIHLHQSKCETDFLTFRSYVCLCSVIFCHFLFPIVSFLYLNVHPLLSLLLSAHTVSLFSLSHLISSLPSGWMTYFAFLSSLLCFTTRKSSK